MEVHTFPMQCSLQKYLVSFMLILAWVGHLSGLLLQILFGNSELNSFQISKKRGYDALSKPLLYDMFVTVYLMCIKAGLAIRILKTTQ